jgi:hypothetical protein
MSNRLDKEREQRLQPKRIAWTVQQLKDMGYTIALQTNTEVRFNFKGHQVKFYPYSGWHSGKSITDGRGWENLLKQIMPKP